MITFREYEHKQRTALGQTFCNRLQALDARFASTEGQTVFDWSRRKTVAAKQYVGVMQDGDVAVEILPKTTDDDKGARNNLLYMLSVAGRLPVRDREMAALRVENLPVYEALIRLFVERLLDELRRGLDHHYLPREENCGMVRGKILLSEHIKKNAGHNERVFVRYDEFLADTWLNRGLKAACRRLLRCTRRPATQRELQQAILTLADVADVHVQPHHLEHLYLPRSSERFEDVLTFAKIVLFEGGPAPTAGDTRTFSMLVPMDRLFEEFVGRLIRRHAPELGFARASVKLQARGSRRYLLKQRNPTRGLYKLKPDVLVLNRPGQDVTCVLDTKWKRLDMKANRRPSEADMYQLYAYANSYNAALSVLLYPRVPGLSSCDYFDNAVDNHRLRVAFVDVNRDLRRERSAFLADLRAAVARPGEPAT